MKYAQSGVLILTQPLGTNYGGILQAHALQSVIRELGCDVDTNIAPVPPPCGPSAVYWVTKRRFNLVRRKNAQAQGEINANLREFITRRISSTNLYAWSRRPPQSTLRRYTTFIVGSDQVWRPPDSDVCASLFDFFPPSSSARRFSYAASFGIDSGLEYSKRLRARTRRLAERLDAISVREESGVNVVRELWGREDAVAHVDPTLLLPRDHYDEIVACNSPIQGSAQDHGIASYLLDKTSTKVSVVRQLSTESGLPVNELLPPQPNSLSEYASAPRHFHKPPVESWLKSIREAEIVVTDSFHGAVFAIMYHRPFLLLANDTRGSARLDSLLSMLGLTRRLYSGSSSGIGSTSPLDLTMEEVDWLEVEQRLRSERCRAIEYLTRYIV